MSSDKMTPYTSLEMMTKWASTYASQETPEKWLPTLVEVVSYWITVSSEPAYQRLCKVCYHTQHSQWHSLVTQIGQSYGLSALQAVEHIARILANNHPQESIFALLNDLLLEEEIQALKPPSVSATQKVFGRAIVERVMGLKAAEPFKATVYGQITGYLALPLIGAGLSMRERICFGSLMIDALAVLHDQRLEPSQGLAPERLMITHRFELFAPLSKPTKLKPLFSPEQQRGEPSHKSSDVWSVARLALSLFTGKPLSTPHRKILPELAEEIAEPLKRALNHNPEERYYSGKELKVILAIPLDKWVTQLNYEAQVNESEVDTSEGELILPYEDYAQKREEESESKAAKRRAKEHQLRNKQSRKMKLRQSLGLVVFILLFGGVYLGYSTYAEMKAIEQKQLIAEALERRDRFDLRDQIWQKGVPTALQKAGFKWRFISSTMPADGTRVYIKKSSLGLVDNPIDLLMSVSEVTLAQYRVCVEAEKCVPRSASHSCPIKDNVNPNLPVTCVTYEEARQFAQFVGGRLPMLREWHFAANHSSSTPYPWGNQAPNVQLTNLFHDREGAPPTLDKVCSYPLGDSLNGLCDLVGNVHEWVGYKLTQSGMTRGALIGGGWLTPPRTKVMRKQSISKRTKGEDLGFRVVKEPTIPTADDSESEQLNTEGVESDRVDP